MTANTDTLSAFNKITHRFVEKGCENKTRRAMIYDAWLGAEKLSHALTDNEPGYNYDIPHTQWLGNDWNSASSWFPWRWNFRRLIGNNFLRLKNMFSDNAQEEQYIYWYCYDYANECSPGTQAYAWDHLNLEYSYHYTVFCPPFYEERQTMASQIAAYQDNKHEQKVMENFEISRDQIMFHEIWHYEELVSSPRARDYAYQAQNVWDLAKTKGTNWAYVNADSYAMDAVAIYVQRTYQSSISPVPYKELANLDADSYAAVSQPAVVNASSKIFDSVPSGWNGPAVPYNTPDLGLWEEVTYHPPSSSSPSSGTGGQQLAWASYTNPLGDPAAWSRLISYDTNKLSVLVANVLNGPDYVVNPAWADVIQRAAASGKTIIGYVRTGYLGVSVQNFKTRLGSSDLADWASQIEQDVDKWYELYPQIGGIFFDEGWPECGTNNVYSELYAYINAYTKRKHPGAFTVLNPGSPMAQCFENTMDTLLTFESFYDYYKNNYVPNSWTPQDARKIWHIVYNVPADKVAEVADLARSRGAGFVEITDDNVPNPYDNVPAETYMQAAMAGVSGGSLFIGEAPEHAGHYVSGLFATVANVDYTSVTLTWDPAQGALGYGVYKNGALILELPASITRATVGMIDPGTSDISFEVQTLSTSDITRSPIRPIVSTLALPASGAITNVKYTQSGNTVTYTAEVLVPFAFVRLFISGPNPSFPRHGWPISLATSQYNQYKVMNYLVEGNDFYSTYFHYTGAYYEGSSSPADWSWQPLINPTLATTQTTSGYTYTWNFALSDTDAVLSDWLVQGQGYAPIANVWGGCAQRFDGEGHTFNVC